MRDTNLKKKSNTDLGKIENKSDLPKTSEEEHLQAVKGNLFGFILPQECSEQALLVYIYQDANKMLKENTFKRSVSVIWWTWHVVMMWLTLSV